MLLQFQENDAFFLVDLSEQVWLKTLTPPTIDSGEIVIKDALERGVLSGAGYKTWALNPRKPPELCSIGIDIIGSGTTAVIYVRANTEIKNLTMPRPIKTVLYEILPSPLTTAGNK